jgi:hypothetical protein
MKTIVTFFLILSSLSQAFASSIDDGLLDGPAKPSRTYVCKLTYEERKGLKNKPFEAEEKEITLQEDSGKILYESISFQKFLETSGFHARVGITSSYPDSSNVDLSLRIENWKNPAFSSESVVSGKVGPNFPNGYLSFNASEGTQSDGNPIFNKDFRLVCRPKN